MLNERKLTDREVATREDAIKDLKPAKRGFVKRYGRDAEAIMYATATKRAKKKEEEMNTAKCEEIVKFLEIENIKNDNSSAITYYLKSAELDSDAVIWNNIGIIYKDSEDYENALNEFAMAQKQQPNNSDLFAAISYVKRRQGNWVEAQNAMIEACDKDFDNIKFIS